MKETFFDRVIQSETVTAVRRLIIGGLMAASTPFGVAAIAAVSVSMLALNSFVFRHEKIAQQKKLLSFYKDEIAAIEHKSPESLTLEDLKHAAAPKSEGGHGITVIQNELDEIEARKKIRLGSSVISSLITSATLIAIFPLLPVGGIAMIFGLGLIGFGYTAVARTVKAGVEAAFGSHDTSKSINQHLIRICEEIKERPVTPVEIFGLLAESNPKLQERIQQDYHCKFNDLPVIQKTNVVEAFEPELRVIALTNAINKGEIKPSFVGFVAGGHADERLHDFGKYQAMFDKPVEKIPDLPYELAATNVNLSDYRSRMLAEREANSSGKSIH
jgi:hypothetical protein